MITVKPMGQTFKVEVKASEKEKLLFTFKQLTYFQRNRVATACTKMSQGVPILDVGLSAFYNLKFALKEVKGLAGLDGKPYKLEFEKGVDELTDKCVDEVLACDVGNTLLYVAAELGANIPDEILDPMTQKPLAGVEVKTSKGGTQKK